MDFIQLPKRDVLRIVVKNENGEIKKDEKGNDVFLEFDLEDIEAPLKYNKCEFLIRKAREDLKFDIMIIDKRQDVKGKFLLSKNEEDKIKAMQRFYKTMEEAMDLFLGKGGVDKIFGDVRYYTMFEDLNEMLKPILPKLKVNYESIDKKIKEKYAPKETEVLKNE